MAKIKLIASDLDGTLLLEEARSCNPELFPLIEALKEKGVYFIPASGRQYPNLQKLFAPVKNDIMYLCENGALVMHTNQVLAKNVFEDSLAMELANAVLEHPDCEVAISGERTLYLIPKEESYLIHLRDDIGNHVTRVDCPERIEEGIMKVAFHVCEEKRDQVAAEFAARFGERCQLVTSGNRWVDFVPFETSKGNALRAIGDRLGIAPDEMVAFGDNENDRDMLQFVGHPYLMENCNPTMEDVKAKRCHKVEESLREILSQLD